MDGGKKLYECMGHLSHRGRCPKKILHSSWKQRKPRAEPFLLGLNLWNGFCSDLEVINICTGMMTHASQYPCHCQDLAYGIESIGTPLWSFEGNEANGVAWVPSGADPMTLKNYKNYCDILISLMRSFEAHTNPVILHLFACFV